MTTTSIDYQSMTHDGDDSRPAKVAPKQRRRRVVTAVALSLTMVIAIAVAISAVL